MTRETSMDDNADFGLEDIRRAHFIGIGGIGMSGIARLLLKMGFAVSGSDLKASEITRTLKTEGARVLIGHKAGNADGADVVVISSAVRPDNPELKHAVKKGARVVQRAGMLARIAACKKTLTVSGTHGKTTTTSMLASALEAAGADATVVVGGVFKNISSNMKLGAGEYLVAEADESDGSFLHFSPLVTCVTNIDSDHLDYYKNMDNLKRAFVRHIEKVPFYGAAVVCADDPGVADVIKTVRAPLITYGFGPGSDWTISRLAQGSQGVSYDAAFRGRRMCRIALRSGGRHNALNSLAALAAGTYLGFDLKDLSRGLAEFGGVKRRIEKTGECAGVLFLDDYGHHPTEIRATLETVAAMHKGSRLIALFQPHRYSRTSILRREFPRAFAAADAVYVMDIYPAGEKPLPGVTSQLLVDGMKKRGVKAEKFPGAMEIAKNLRAGDVLLTVGAGDVWKSGEEIRLKLEMLKG